MLSTKESTRLLYLDLMKRTVTGVIFEDPPNPATPQLPRDVPLDDPGAYDVDRRAGGEDWPLHAHTMIGLKRIDNLHECVERVLADGVPGDLIETGVWRGGACIFMRAILKAHGVRDRSVWVADSFEGMPVAGEDSGGTDHQMNLHRFNDVLSVSLDEVRENFRRYDLLDEQVQFLPGWFSETLPEAKIDKLAVLRLDGDLYDSTMDALNTLYPKLSPGGYVIIDDFGLNTCRAAITDYRAAHGITEVITAIDRFGAYWRRAGVAEQPAETARQETRNG